MEVYFRGKRVALCDVMMALHDSVQNKIDPSLAAIVALCFDRPGLEVNSEKSRG